MTEPENLESRVSALETRVGDLTERVRGSEQDTAAARVLARCADRDVTQFRREFRDFRRATTASFNCMREDLTDLRAHVDRGFAEINQRFAEINQRFGEVDRGFAEIRGRLDAAAAGQQQIADMLQTLISRESRDQG